jgi:anti-sigma B factor antagonist
MNTALSIETQLLDGEILAVVLDGSLNTTTTDQFNQAIQNHLDQGRTKIIIDCRKVDYVSSLGIGSLVALQARLRKKGGEVKLAALYGVAADAIRLVSLDKLLNIYGDLEFARQSFYPSRPHAPENKGGHSGMASN